MEDSKQKKEITDLAPHAVSFACALIVFQMEKPPWEAITALDCFSVCLPLGITAFIVEHGILSELEPINRKKWISTLISWIQGISYFIGLVGLYWMFYSVSYNTATRFQFVSIACGVLIFLLIVYVAIKKN